MHSRTMYTIQALFLVVVLCGNPFNAFAQESTAIESKIGVIPFSPMGIEEEESEFIARMIAKKLSADKTVIEHDEMMEALDDVDCDDEEDWNKKSCIQEVSNELGADYILAGSIGKVGQSIVAVVTLYDLNKSESVLSKQYSSEGSIESFALSNPGKIAEDVSAILNKRAEVSRADPAQLTVITDETAEPVKIETRKVDFPTIDNGIVKGATIGVKGIFTLGTIDESQSPVGFSAMFLYPTGEKTHIRFRAGIPSWHSENNSMMEGKDYPDPYITLEHAWGWKSFGLSAGLAYMHMQRFTGITEINSGIPYTFKYDPFNAFNFVFSLRGGRTMAGFHGMISFPLAFTIDRQNMNYVIEYCIGGAFGAKKTKVGIGSSGMFKRRYADEVTVVTGNSVTTMDIEDYNDYYYRSDHRVREFFCLLPHIKVAHLFGDFFVASLTLDIGGIIIPRPESKDSWKPAIGCDFIFSFGALDGPNLYDGTF